MSEPKIDWKAVVATWSIARLEAEIDQALAAGQDPENSASYRMAALCAGSMMATELMNKRRALGLCACGLKATWLLLGDGTFCDAHREAVVGFDEADWTRL